MNRAATVASLSSLLLMLASCGDDEPGSVPGATGGGEFVSSGGTGGASLSGGAPGGGATSGGGQSASGAQSSGGGASGGSAGSGGDQTGGGSGGTMGSGGSSGPKDPRVERLSESLLTNEGLTIISYGGYLNGESFQQDGLVTYKGTQYAAFWNSARHVVLAARELPDGDWSRIEFTDYTNVADDAHNTISIGIAPADDSMHLAYDHHDDELNYRRSNKGFLSKKPTEMENTDFGLTNMGEPGEPGPVIQSVTYPRFITSPTGRWLLMSMRIGASGNGTAHLWKYDGPQTDWLETGRYVDGSSVDQNPYFHGIAFEPNQESDRLHFAWCTRATPDATTNHDLYYAYSDDLGQTFYDNAGQMVGTAGTSPLSAIDDGLRVWQISQDRGLINQESMVVDRDGGVHVLLSHMPDSQQNDSDFTRARTNSEFFHYYRSPNGTWKRTALGAPVVDNLRGSLAVSQSGNVYAVLPDMRIYGASQAADFEDWTEMYADKGRFFSDPLIDAGRLQTEDVLSIFYPLKNSGDIYVLDFSID